MLDRWDEAARELTDERALSHPACISIGQAAALARRAYAEGLEQAIRIVDHYGKAEWKPAFKAQLGDIAATIRWVTSDVESPVREET